MRRPDFFLFALIGFSHADDVANVASLRVANDDHSAVEIAEADDALFAIIFSLVFELGNRALEYLDDAVEIELSLYDGFESFFRIV